MPSMTDCTSDNPTKLSFLIFYVKVECLLLNKNAITMKWSCLILKNRKIKEKNWLQFSLALGNYIPGKIQTREYPKLTLYPKSSGWGSTKLLTQICMNFCNFRPQNHEII